MLGARTIAIIALCAMPGCVLDFSVGSLPVGSDDAPDADAAAEVSDGFSDQWVDALDVADDTPPRPIDAGSDVGDTSVDVAPDRADVPASNDVRCADPLAACGGMCVDESIDPGHCGSCNTTCPAAANATPACASHQCTFVCMPGFLDCDMMASTGCESNSSNDNANCGACRVRCNGINRCVSGRCTH